MMRRDFDRNCPSSAMMSRQAFWKTLISQSVPFPRYVFTAQGAQFSVSRERLRARPRSYYERLLREMDYAVNPYQGHHFEYFWLYLLQPDDEHLRSLAQREPELRRGGALWTSRVTAWPLMAAQGSYRQSRHYFTEYSRIVQSPMHPLRRSAVTRRLRSHACKSILFVDHENTCLSPYVDARFRARVGSAGHVRSASAGLASDGLQIPQIALEVGRERKLDLIGHRSRRLNADILASVDLVLAMSPWAAGEVRRRWPEWRGPIELFAALDPQLSPASMRIPDTGTQWWRINDETLRKFRLAFEQADRCVDVLAGLVSDQTDQSASRTETVRQERALR
jgi:protein-tyrosine-phosphatase